MFAGTLSLGCCVALLAAALLRLQAQNFSTLFVLGLLPCLHTPLAAAICVAAAVRGVGGLLERWKYSPSARSSTENFASWPAATHARYSS